MIIVGLDWSRSKHDFVIMDLQGKVIERGAVAHNANALEELATSIKRHVSDVEQVNVGLELNNEWCLAGLVSRQGILRIRDPAEKCPTIPRHLSTQRKQRRPNRCIRSGRVRPGQQKSFEALVPTIKDDSGTG